MIVSNAGKAAKEKAAQLCQEGLDYYSHWDIQRAIETYKAAITLDQRQPDYYLYLAQAYVRLGDYENMRRALGGFLEFEPPNSELTERYQLLFGSKMDGVEISLTRVMTQQEVPLEVIGAAIQMWLEFRVAMGRKTIPMQGRHAPAWAGALDYTIRKVNFYEVSVGRIARWYEVTPQMVRKKYAALIDTLDVMPCDYRYFRGVDNPLDKLVEAATMLERLEERFYRS